MPDVGLGHALNEGGLRAATSIVEEFLSAPDNARADDAPNFEQVIGRLADWLARSGGARNVRVLDGVLKSHPPQKLVQFTASVEHRERDIVLTLELGRSLKVRSLEYQQP